MRRWGRFEGGESRRRLGGEKGRKRFGKQSLLSVVIKN